VNEAKQLYVFKIDERQFCAVGTAIFAADTKEEARSMFYGLKWRHVEKEIEQANVDGEDDDNTNTSVDPTTDNRNEPFIDNKYTKVLFHRPEKINRFMETIWYLEYEFFLRVSVSKGLKSFTFNDG